MVSNIERAKELDPSLYECVACSAKPGSPALCRRCIAARTSAGDKWRGPLPREDSKSTLAAALEQSQARVRELEQELARIKGAALSVPEIQKRHQSEVATWTAAHHDRATLIDALRAKEADFLAYWQHCKDVLGDERVSGRPIPDCIADLMQERDELGNAVTALHKVIRESPTKSEFTRMRGIIEAVAAHALNQRWCLLCGCENPSVPASHPPECAHRLAVEWKREQAKREGGTVHASLEDRIATAREDVSNAASTLARKKCEGALYDCEEEALESAREHLQELLDEQAKTIAREGKE